MPKKPKEATSTGTYCVSCKKQTADASEPTMKTTTNGRSLLQTTCANCDSKKCKFVKS